MININLILNLEALMLSTGESEGVKLSSNSNVGLSYVDYTGWNQFSWVGIGSDDVSPLSLSLLSFKTHCKDEHNVEIEWRTASESNVFEFLLEGLVNNEWKIIGRHIAQKFSNSMTDYRLTVHNTPNIELIRLSKVDTDGSVNEIKIIKNTCLNNSLYKETFSIFPNPNQGLLNVKFENFKEDTEYNFEIINHYGQIILSQSLFFNEKFQQTQFNIEHLRDGVYWVRIYIQGSNSYQTKTFIKRN